MQVHQDFNTPSLHPEAFSLPHLGPLPELDVEQWLNTEQPLSLAQCRGRVVALYVFQMLCPSCISHSLPQAKQLRQAFTKKDLVVIGLHSVFEHHSAMPEVSLRAFLKEYEIDLPVAIDRASDMGIPHSMQNYGLQGTPSLLLIDQSGRLRRHYFGLASDIELGAEIMELILSDDTASFRG